MTPSLSYKDITIINNLLKTCTCCMAFPQIKSPIPVILFRKSPNKFNFLLYTNYQIFVFQNL